MTPEDRNLQSNAANSQPHLFLGDQTEDGAGFDRAPLIDPLLEESLGRKSPPDLTAAILSRLAAQGIESLIPMTSNGHAAPANPSPAYPLPSNPLSNTAQPRSLRPIPLSPDTARPAAIAPAAVSRVPRRRQWSPALAGCVAAALSLVVACGIWLANRNDHGSRLANDQPNTQTPGPQDIARPQPNPNQPNPNQPNPNQPNPNQGNPTPNSASPATGNPLERTATHSPTNSPGQPGAGSREWQDSPDRIADSQGKSSPEDGPESGHVPSDANNPRGSGQPHPPLPRELVNNGSAGERPRQPSNQNPGSPTVVSPDPVAALPADATPPAVVAATPRPGANLLLSHGDQPVVQMVNHHIRARWHEAGISPSPPASDAEWCRRVYLDVIGRIPTMYEIQTFVSNRSPERREQLIHRLLDSDEYLEEYAQNWSNIWANLLIGRSNDNELVDREGFQQYLRRTFLTNKPYDQFVSELITATGDNTPGTPDFNGAVNFLLDNLQENATPATAKTARIFLGVQVQCTQCHNHPFHDAKQNQFWELNAFFRQARPESRQAAGSTVTRLVDVDFAGEGSTPSEAEIYYELRCGVMKIAYPVFLTGEQIGPSGLINDVNRRRELAAIMTSSDMFRKAIVNRLWSHFLSYGFTHPIDDMGPHNSVSHPELLEQLSSAFAQSGFDYKRLVRWITLSEAYGLSSREVPHHEVPSRREGDGGRLAHADQPENGGAALFSRFYIRQMRPEELYESLLVATHASPDQAVGIAGMRQTDLTARQREKNQWLEQFAISLDTDENDEASTFDGTISQTLMMWNGEMVRKATSGDRGTFLSEVVRAAQHGAAQANNAQASTAQASTVQDLFVAALGRNPSKLELNQARELWRRRQGDTSAALQDLWWVLLNSNEFILNH